MAEISASLVMKLRKTSGQGMMDCKKALEEANGDIEKAMVILRKKGLAVLDGRAKRETTEGVVIGVEGNGWASLATVCCETDFVARSDDFIAAVEAAKKHIEVCNADCGAEALCETKVGDRKFSEVITETVSKTGEKMIVGDYARFCLDGPGLISTYIHFNGKVGTMVHIDTSNEAVAASNELKRTAADIAMHITATKPLSLDKDGISAETIAQERAIYAEQVKGKPANIVDKIVDGKVKRFFAENCLIEQQFVKDNSKTVSQVLEEAAKKAGGTAKIKRFVRFEVG